jgi:hypothetical protein
LLNAAQMQSHPNDGIMKALEGQARVVLIATLDATCASVDRCIQAVPLLANADPDLLEQAKKWAFDLLRD